MKIGMPKDGRFGDFGGKYTFQKHLFQLLKS